MLLDCLADSLLGDVNAELLVDVVQEMKLHLGNVCVDGVVNYFVGNVHVSYKELFLFVDLQDIEMLHCAVHHGAGVNADHRVEELVAAFDAAFHQCTCILAGVVGHVVGRDIDGASVGCAQTHGETVAYVEKNLGNMVAGIAKADIALSLSLLYQVIVGILKKTFEVDQMLKIFQMLHLFFKEFLFFGALPLLH